MQVVYLIRYLEKIIVSWSSMIASYAKNGQPRQALELFEQFREQAIELDETYILAFLFACS